MTCFQSLKKDNRQVAPQNDRVGTVSGRWRRGSRTCFCSPNYAGNHGRRPPIRVGSLLCRLFVLGIFSSQLIRVNKICYDAFLLPNVGRYSIRSMTMGMASQPQPLALSQAESA